MLENFNTKYPPAMKFFLLFCFTAERIKSYNMSLHRLPTPDYCLLSRPHSTSSKRKGILGSGGQATEQAVRQILSICDTLFSYICGASGSSFQPQPLSLQAVFCPPCCFFCTSNKFCGVLLRVMAGRGISTGDRFKHVLKT